MPSTAHIARFLKGSLHTEFSFAQKLKIAYRPYICPFDDLLALLPEHTSVLDIGFGAGIFLALVGEFKAPLKLGGLEVRDEHVAAARLLLEKNAGVPTTLAVYDGINLPSWICEYEYIFMIDVLHHIPKERQTALLREIYRLMKPGSKFIIKEMDASSPFLIFNTLHDLAISRELVHEISPNRLVETLQSIGFQTRLASRKRLYVYPHYTVLAEKI